MASTELDVLRDKIYAAADARLRRKIDERLDPIRQAVSGRNLQTPVLEARSYDLMELVQMIADRVFAIRRDQERAELTTTFLSRVREGGFDV